MDDESGFEREDAERARLLGIAPALAKAIRDAFDYVLGTRDGRIIRFSQASMEPGDEWVLLSEFGNWEGHGMAGQEFTFERGLYVRIADIVWVADAPQGS